MPKINIDELVEPIEVTVGGKAYTIEDISQETAKKMESTGEQTKDTNDLDLLVGLMTEVLGAEKVDMAKLGMRKLLMLVKQVTEVVNKELEGKNVPKAAVKK